MRRLVGLRRWGPAAVTMAAIALLSHQPSLPALPGGPPDWLLHGVEFGFLALACAWGTTDEFAARRRTVPRLLLALGLAAVYGAIDEWHQSFVPSRDASFLDWVADAGGALLATAGLWVLLSRTRRRP